jgi:hypothetical protein
VSTEDTITREELAAAFRSGFLYTHSASAAHAAQEVFAHVVRNREPEYEPGAVYQDPAGRAWCRLRTDDGEADWRCCESGTLYSARYPDRPLRKLVPETLPASAPPVPHGEAVVIPGEMYEDAGGRRFHRLSSDEGWLLLPEVIPLGGCGGKDYPVYPLRKLVPEPVQDES